MLGYNLDIETPEQLPALLDSVAERFRESAAELSGAWQDTQAGRIWADYATILERAARSARVKMANRGFLRQNKIVS